MCDQRVVARFPCHHPTATIPTTRLPFRKRHWCFGRVRASAVAICAHLARFGVGCVVCRVVTPRMRALCLVSLNILDLLTNEHTLYKKDSA